MWQKTSLITFHILPGEYYVQAVGEHNLVTSNHIDNHLRISLLWLDDAWFIWVFGIPYFTECFHYRSIYAWFIFSFWSFSICARVWTMPKISWFVLTHVKPTSQSNYNTFDMHPRCMLISSKATQLLHILKNELCMLDSMLYKCVTMKVSPLLDLK